MILSAMLKTIFQFIRGMVDMDSQEIVNKRYRHYKTGELYEVIGVARHSETKEEMVVYRSLYHGEKFENNPWWVRPKKMFFEQVVWNGHFVPRFKSITNEEIEFERISSVST